MHDEQLSSHIQANQIRILLNHIIRKFLEGLHGEGFYSIIADEVTDKVTKRCLFCVSLDTRERLAAVIKDFANIGRTTREVIANEALKDTLKNRVPIER
jgi:hypothetical protein